ncbi:unnamed protein product [Protopolystoma xenopodis]|uniref:Uncharacterized protein n=1 Tax=Protopolystoma xenopodis TaxID=117903 RepID=A0A3S5FBY2_9PLAT|nr:unnamed protein product [Protopolystoma xenopodis]
MTCCLLLDNPPVPFVRPSLLSSCAELAYSVCFFYLGFLLLALHCSFSHVGPLVVKSPSSTCPSHFVFLTNAWTVGKAVQPGFVRSPQPQAELPLQRRWAQTEEAVSSGDGDVSISFIFATDPIWRRFWQVTSFQTHSSLISVPVGCSFSFESLETSEYLELMLAAL